LNRHREERSDSAIRSGRHSLAIPGSLRFGCDDGLLPSNCKMRSRR
jgi:hypothetical protein